MNKNRALAIGAGLVVVLLSWVAAFSNGFGSGGAAAAATPATRPAPVVRTVQPTATVHEKANSIRGTQPQVVIRSSSGAGWSYPSGTGGSSDQNGSDNGGGFGVPAVGDD